MRIFTTKQTKRVTQKGVTLIELMVALVIGLIVSLAVYTVLSNNEGRKRTTTSINDIDQTASYVSYMLDKSLRSAGTGFSGGRNPRSVSLSSNLPTTAANYTFGCLLKVSRGSTVLVPNAAAYSAPFGTVPTALRLAPIVIIDNAATNGDVLVMMSGSGGLSESVNNLDAAPATSILTLTNVAGFTADDKMLLLGTNNANASPLAGTPCLMEQVVSTFVQGTGSTYSLGLASGTTDYRVDPVTYTSITSTGVAFNLGKSPSFLMFGVGANNTLFRYDLLLPSGTDNPSQFADGVYSMQAIYGVSATPGSLVWTAPTGAFSSATLLDGSAASNQNLRNIKAIRVALIMRTSLPEKEVVSPATLNVFETTGTATTVTVNLSNTYYRYRVVESTIPIRNALALD